MRLWGACNVCVKRGGGGGCIPSSGSVLLPGDNPRLYTGTEPPHTQRPVSRPLAEAPSGAGNAPPEEGRGQGDGEVHALGEDSAAVSRSPGGASAVGKRDSGEGMGCGINTGVTSEDSTISEASGIRTRRHLCGTAVLTCYARKATLHKWHPLVLGAHLRGILHTKLR